MNVPERQSSFEVESYAKLRYDSTMDATGLPANHLAPRVKAAWRINMTLSGLVALLLMTAAGVALVIIDIPRLLAAALPLATIVISIVVIWLIPEIRFRRWRWEVTDVEVRLQSGLIIIERTVIPMVRIQHVDTSQGPIMRAFDLSEVRISTAAGAHSIPALTDRDAAALRDRIAVLARATDDDGL